MPSSAPNTDERAARRKHLRQLRRDIPAKQRIAAADGLAAQLLALPFLPDAGFVAGYWASDGEIALHAFQLKLPKSLTYCLPVLHGEELRFAPWHAGDALVSNRFGIPEPDVDPATALEADAMALVAVPLVGFDTRGHRLGMGGGWYDRSFHFRKLGKGTPHLVGVGFEAQRVEAIRAEAWDVPLDAVCTESNTYLTGNGA